jgi:hypothetical protein
MVNFTKSDNHESSLTNMAMRVLLDNDNNRTTMTVIFFLVFQIMKMMSFAWKVGSTVLQTAYQWFT